MLLPLDVVDFSPTLLLLLRASLFLDGRSGFHSPLFPLSIGGPFLVVVGSGKHTSVSSLGFVVSLVHEDFLCSQRSSRVVVLHFRMGVDFPFLLLLSTKVVFFK